MAWGFCCHPSCLSRNLNRPRWKYSVLISTAMKSLLIVYWMNKREPLSLTRLISGGLRLTSLSLPLSSDCSACWVVCNNLIARSMIDPCTIELIYLVRTGVYTSNKSSTLTNQNFLTPCLSNHAPCLTMTNLEENVNPFLWKNPICSVWFILSRKFTIHLDKNVALSGISSQRQTGLSMHISSVKLKNLFNPRFVLFTWLVFDVTMQLRDAYFPNIHLEFVKMPTACLAKTVCVVNQNPGSPR